VKGRTKKERKKKKEKKKVQVNGYGGIPLEVSRISIVKLHHILSK
jgi:hypothetical protein